MKFAGVPDGKASQTQPRNKIGFWKGWAGRNVIAKSDVCTVPPKVSMKVRTEKEEQSGNTGVTNIALERQMLQAGYSLQGLAHTHSTEQALLRAAPLRVLLTHRHNEGLSTGRGGTGGWKEAGITRGT